MMYVKKLERQKEEHFPKPIFVNNHVHYIGETKCLKQTMIKQNPHFYFLFLDFTDYGEPKQPIYFNTVRDPYDR